METNEAYQPEEVGLRDRLRFAAGALAADFEGELSIDAAENLVFTSAASLMASASVLDYVPILAERHARRTARAGSADWSEAPEEAEPVPAEPVPVPAPPAVRPLLAVPPEQVDRLRTETGRLRDGIATWTAQIPRPRPIV